MLENQRRLQQQGEAWAAHEEAERWAALTPEQRVAEVAAFERRREEERQARIRAWEAKRLREREREGAPGRIEGAVARLRELGSPGLEQRTATARIWTFWHKLAGSRSGKEVTLTLAPAWPVGTFAWVKHGWGHEEWVEEVPTGCTSAGEIVPLNSPSETDSLQGATEWVARVLSVPTTDKYRRLGISLGASPRTPPVELAEIASALERRIAELDEGDCRA